MTPSAIIDANVFLEVVLKRAGYEQAREALERHVRNAPLLCLSECANVLGMAARNGTLSVADATETMAFIRSSVAILPDDHLYGRIVELSVVANHHAYDAVYVALAEAQDLPLLTFDRELVRKFRRVVPDVALVDLNNEDALL